MNITVSSSITVTAPARRAFVDLTEQLRAAVESSAVVNGVVFAFCAHTTCSLAINEWEDGAHYDLQQTLDELVPTGRYYRHDDLDLRTQNLQTEEPANGDAHVGQMLVGNTSQMVPVVGSRTVLGRWQRLMLLELDVPKPRDIYFTVLGSAPSQELGEARRMNLSFPGTAGRGL